MFQKTAFMHQIGSLKIIFFTKSEATNPNFYTKSWALDMVSPSTLRIYELKRRFNRKID